MSERTQPLRALHVIPTLTGGGAENFVCALLQSFDPGVVEPAVMSVYPTEDPFSAESAARHVRVLPIARRGRYDPAFFPRMVANIRAFAPDIVHAHLHNGKYWGRLAALAANVPVILFTQHNPCGEKRIFCEALADAWINRLTGGIATFTEPQRAAIARSERVPIERVVTIPNGIALPPVPEQPLRERARSLLGVDSGELAILVVGRLIPQKNQILAVRALSAMDPAERARVRLIVAGGGEDFSAMRSLAETANVLDRVVLLGPRADARELMYGADVFYMPSLAEGMPLAMLEAMSIGVPVISTPWTGVAELLRDGSFGWILRDWEPLTSAQAFTAAISARDELARKAALACAYVRQQHDIRRIARLHEAWYLDEARRCGVA